MSYGPNRTANSFARGGLGAERASGTKLAALSSDAIATRHGPCRVAWSGPRAPRKAIDAQHKSGRQDDATNSTTIG